MKKMGFKFFTFLMILAAFGSSIRAYGHRIDRNPSAIPRDSIQLQKPASAAFSADLISSYNYVKTMEKPFDISQVVPLDLKPTNDSGAVFSKVADQSMTSLFNSPEMRASPVGQTAASVEQKMKQDLILSQGPIQHKISFQVLAFQSVAQLDYKGFTNATLKYKANESSVAFEISEKVTRTKDLIVSHITKPEDRVSSVGMRWNF